MRGRIPVTVVLWIATVNLGEEMLTYGDGSGSSMAAALGVFVIAAVLTLVIWFREIVGQSAPRKAKRGGAADEALQTLWSLMSADERASMRERLRNQSSDGELPVAYEEQYPTSGRFDSH